MNLRSNITLAGLFVLFTALGSIQGSRVAQMREDEVFYRWLVNASTQSYVGDSLIFDRSPDLPEPMDDELFGRVLALAEETFPDDIPVNPEMDLDAAGNPHPALVRASRHELDDLIWGLATDPASKEMREDFITFAASGQLQSLGTQFSTASLYSQDEQVYGLGVTSMFLGFRKLAANFLWLQVDSLWHSGQLHLMVPLMRTCVTLDPNFVDAYQLGAWHMAYNISARLPVVPEAQKEFHPIYKKRLGLKEEWYYIATDYLKDGIRKNPRDYRLYFDLGYAVYENKIGDHENAVRYLKEARRHRHERWVPRMLFYAQTLNGDYEDALDGWEEYLRMFPDTDFAETQVRHNLGMLSEAIYEDARACRKAAEAAMTEKRENAKAAREAGDIAGAEALEEEADRARIAVQEMDLLAKIEKKKAMDIWNMLYEQEDDTRAYSRILRMGAMDFVESGRYLEAISELEAARWNYPTFFEEATNLILDIKVENGLLLDISERMAVERRNEAAKYASEIEVAKRERRRVDCDYITQ